VYRSGQEHILEALDLFSDATQKAEFLSSVNDTNMELLDSVAKKLTQLYHILFSNRKPPLFSEAKAWQRIIELDPLKPEN